MGKERYMGGKGVEMSVEAPPRYRWVALSLAFSLAFIEHILLFSYSPLIPDVVEGFGLSYAEAGAVFSICIAMLILLRIPWGVVVDKIGLRASGTLASAFMAAGGLLRCYAPTYATFLAANALLGVGVAVVVLVLPRVVAKWFPPKETGFATWLYVSGFAIGSIAALALTPIIQASLLSWRATLAVYGWVALVFTFIWFALAKEPRSAGAGGDEHLLQGLKEVLGKRDTWLLTALFIFSGGCYDTYVTWLPTILEARGIPHQQAGVYASAVPIGFLFSAPLMGFLSDKVGLRKPFIYGFAPIAAFSIALTYAMPIEVIWVAPFVTGFAILGMFSVTMAMAAENPYLLPYVSTAVGVISSVGNLGSFLFPMAVGYVRDVTGSFYGATLLLGAVPLLGIVVGALTTETGWRAAGKQ